MLEDTQLRIHAYLDGELGPDDAAAVEALLDRDPDASAHCAAFAKQKTQLRDAMDAFAAQPPNFETARLARLLAAAIRRRSAPHGRTGLGA